MRAIAPYTTAERPSRPASPSVDFLRWALPRLGLTWSGFRRVHRRVWRRIGRRLAELHLSGPDAYRAYLLSHADEWAVLDSLCRISISRFLRDHDVFEALGREVLPVLIERASRQPDGRVRAWSAGCASGEEPFGLVLLWHFARDDRFPAVTLDVLATDVDEALIDRARAGRYRRSSLREVPKVWVDTAFVRDGDWFVLREEFRSGVEFRVADLRGKLPDRTFDLILCRNVVCTYFDESLQRRTLGAMLPLLRLGGALVIGREEHLPPGLSGLADWIHDLGIFRRATAFEACASPREVAPPWS